MAASRKPAEVAVVVAPDRALWLDDEHHYPAGAELRLPKPAADALIEQGVVKAA